MANWENVLRAINMASGEFDSKSRDPQYPFILADHRMFDQISQSCSNGRKASGRVRGEISSATSTFGPYSYRAAVIAVAGIWNGQCSGPMCNLAASIFCPFGICIRFIL